MAGVIAYIQNEKIWEIDKYAESLWVQYEEVIIFVRKEVLTGSGVLPIGTQNVWLF